MLLAGTMLAIGIGVGAAIGPAPNASFAGATPGLLARLPGLIAAIAGREHAATQAHASSETATAEAGSEQARRRRRRRHAGASTSSTEAGAESQGSGSEAQAGSSSPAKHTTPAKSKLPAVTDVWLIELSGESFASALAAPASAPYIAGTLVHTGELLSGFSALDGAALANEAALLAPSSASATPPIVHSIVQPACAEGAAAAACASPSTALSAADAFLKTTLAQITGSAAYREHGLVVVTFATLTAAGEAGLPAGASNATLTSKPPAGVLLLSPFAKAGAHPALSFNATSPKQSLETLLG